MRYLLTAVCGASLLLAGCSPAAQNTSQNSPAQASAPAPAANAATPPGTPPEAMEFQSSRDGNVTFTHLKHIERANGDCSTCHPKVFPQSREPINYGKALHRVSEAKRNACAVCHAVGGSAFAADSNCPKCHQMRRPRG